MKRQLMTATATVRTLSLSEREGLGVKSTDGEEDHGAFEVILSTPDKDRDGEEVKTEEWQQPLPEHITFDHDHGMSVASTVGSGVPVLEDGNLVVRGTYASTDLAQNVRTLVKEGHIRTTSVAFMRKAVTVDGERVVRRELLNGAFVAIPANPAAVVRSTKALSDLTEDDETDEDPEQTATAASKSLAGAVRKALAGSFEERQQAIQYALDRQYRHTSTYAYLVGTTDAEAVWRTWDYSADDERAEWRAGYDVDANGRVTLQEAVRVRVVEVVTEAVETTTETAQATGRSGEQGAVQKDAALAQVRGTHAPEQGDQHDEGQDQSNEADEMAAALASMTNTQHQLDALLGSAH